MWRGLALAVLLASSAQAEAPKSAIDWLSESLLQPPNFVITPPAHTGHSLDTTSISAMPLEMISRDAAGLLPPEVTGFPRAIWGDTPSEKRRAAAALGYEIRGAGGHVSLQTGVAGANQPPLG